VKDKIFWKNKLINSKPSKLRNSRFTENWYTGY